VSGGSNAAENFKHVGGAKDTDGKPVREIYLPNKDVSVGQYGRKGSSNPDITYHYKPTETDLHLNTGKMRKDGKTGIASERRSLANMVKNAGRPLASLLPKSRPGMDVEDLDQAAKEVLREQLTKLLGPPAK